MIGSQTAHKNAYPIKSIVVTFAATIGPISLIQFVGTVPGRGNVTAF